MRSMFVSRDLRYDLYVEHYCRDFSDLFGTSEDTSPLKAGQLNVYYLVFLLHTHATNWRQEKRRIRPTKSIFIPKVN